MTPGTSQITALLVDWGRGDQAALERLLPVVYRELRRTASRQLRHERVDHTLQPTALVHEAFLKLVGERRMTWQNRAQFFAVASRQMRRVLVDHARAVGAAKRRGLAYKMPLEDVGDVASEAFVDVAAVDEALDQLAMLDAEQARIVEMRFFGGMSVEETAVVIGRSPRTVKRQWRVARAWLFQRLKSLR